MEPLGAEVSGLAGAIAWPDPNDDGTTTLPADTLRQVRALINALTSYLEAQLERCRVPDA
jgi:hypothetical protein